MGPLTEADPTPPVPEHGRVLHSLGDGVNVFRWSSAQAQTLIGQPSKQVVNLTLLSGYNEV